MSTVLSKDYFRLMPLKALVLSLVFSQSAIAQNQSIDLESTFKGNQEQPKVLYIVPWQKIDAPEAYYQPLESLINENFELLDRDEFRREVRFYDQLTQSAE
jgi:hypothetical protein